MIIFFRIWINIFFNFSFFFQYEYRDYLDRNITLGPIFHRDEFLKPLLDLQEAIKGLQAPLDEGDRDHTGKIRKFLFVVISTFPQFSHFPRFFPFFNQLIL